MAKSADYYKGMKDAYNRILNVASPKSRTICAVIDALIAVGNEIGSMQDEYIGYLNAYTPTEEPKAMSKEQIDAMESFMRFYSSERSREELIYCLKNFMVKVGDGVTWGNMGTMDRLTFMTKTSK